MYKRQVIVALEGVDGAGKTTLIDLLGAEFGNLAGVYSRTKKGKIVDYIVSSNFMQKNRQLQIPIYLLLSLKNYLFFFKNRHKQIILMDRCFLSNFCYFYFDYLFDKEKFERMMRFEVKLLPQKIFIINIEPLTAYQRDKKRKQMDWIISTQKKYLLCKNSPMLEGFHIEILDNNMTIVNKKDRISNYIRGEMGYGY